MSLLELHSPRLLPDAMDKSRLRDAIVEKILVELDLLTRAAHMARDEATSEESKAENKYDTRGQEAAYLAEGQARIAKELHETLTVYQGLTLTRNSADQPIGIGALVTLDAGAHQAFYFVGPRSGGIEVSVDGRAIVVVTPPSPLGRQLLGKRLGEQVQLPGRGGSITHRVVAIE